MAALYNQCSRRASRFKRAPISSTSPNFGPPDQLSHFSLSGQSTQMLGAWLGSGGQAGGLNPLYQIGGTRSAQLVLKLLL
jgi:hypothetical protein